jgi:hypothetical protein
MPELFMNAKAPAHLLLLVCSFNRTRLHITKGIRSTGITLRYPTVNARATAGPDTPMLWMLIFQRRLTMRAKSVLIE